MNMKENNKYRYTDTSERNIRMNRFYIIATSLLAISNSQLILVIKNCFSVLSVVKTDKSQHFAHCYIRKYHSDCRFLCGKCRDTPSK